jgi:hypothetical protein
MRPLGGHNGNSTPCSIFLYQWLWCFLLTGYRDWQDGQDEEARSPQRLKDSKKYQELQELLTGFAG